MKKKALIAMSGGVDSAVAAYLMQQRGFDCMGAMLRLHRKAEGSCGSDADADDARAVADRLGIPFQVYDFSEKFQEAVVNGFVRSYEAGATPNPCILCNRYLKFGSLFEVAANLGADCLVTGHYARIVLENGNYQLKKGRTENKDQSYVLYNLTQEQLAHIQFPLGDRTKEEVRAIAEAQGLVNARKKDSQDICFVPDGDYAGFIRRATGKSYPEGNFVDESGRILGRHKGIICYTIGQRRGLGVSGGRPLYVKEIDPAANTVALADNAGLFERGVLAGDFNWISGSAPREAIRVRARARYHHPEQWATAQVTQGGVRIVFDEPQRALTRGQSVVLYDGDTVLGGGIIEKILKNIGAPPHNGNCGLR